MSEATEAGGNGPLTVDQAVSLLQAPVEAAAPETDTEDLAPEGDEPEPDEISEPEGDPEPEGEAGAEAEPPASDEDEGVGEGPAETSAADAPQFWDAAAKARFKELPADLQQVIAESERGREAAKAQAVEAASVARKEAEGRASELTQLNAEIRAFLPQAKEKFAGKWDGYDWAKMAQEDPAKWVADKQQFESDQAEIGRLSAAQEATRHAEHLSFVKEQGALLSQLAPEHAPDLIDPKTGPQARQDVASYLLAGGIKPDALNFISAAETVIAWKAMQWDKVQAATKAALAKKPAPKPAAPSPQRQPTSAARPAQAVRPGAAPAGRSPRQNNLQAAESRLTRSGRMDDALALLDAREVARRK